MSYPYNQATTQERMPAATFWAGVEVVIDGVRELPPVPIVRGEKVVQQNGMPPASWGLL